MSSLALTDDGATLRRGRRLAICAAILVCLLAAGLLAAYGAGDDGLRAVIRNTARTSFALFLAAFAAPALRALRPAARWTRRLEAFDPHLYAAFAASHFVHAAAIFALAAQTGGASLAGRSAAEIALGGLTYLFILLAAAPTSRAAARWLGRRDWARLLRAFGLLQIWLAFFNSYGGRVAEGELFYLPFAALLVAALALRLAALPKMSLRRAEAG